MTTTNQFETLLKEFNVLITENKKDAKKEIETLKAKAIVGAGLTGRQAEAILVRCNNFLSGTYGNTKKNVKF